jgi:hypothetical protein
MTRFVQSAALAVALCASAGINAFGQAPPLIFTGAAPAPASTSTEPEVRASAVIEERGLALWGGTSSDFGLAVDVSGRRWAVRSTASMTMLKVDNHLRPTFQQVEIVRPLFSTGSATVAAGGGIRQEWDGTQVLIGRTLAGADFAGGRVQGGLVMEHALSATVNRDAADVVTSVGWSRRIGDQFAMGVEGIGQDLEGFWNPAEAEGGAKLLVGPSLHVQSRGGDWSASATVGPVMRTRSTVVPADVAGAMHASGGRHFGFFASASWLPSGRH